MGDGEFKKYDSDDNYSNWSARLTKDAEVKEGEKTRVKITFVSTSRSENHHDLWVTADINEGQAPLAAFLKKGDIVGVEGKPYQWGDANPQFALNFARLHLTGELINKLKERGFVPGQKGRPTSKAAPKKTGKPTRPIIDLPDDEE